jgi:hypothetical protein
VLEGKTWGNQKAKEADPVWQQGQNNNIMNLGYDNAQLNSP